MSFNPNADLLAELNFRDQSRKLAQDAASKAQLKEKLQVFQAGMSELRDELSDAEMDGDRAAYARVKQKIEKNKQAIEQIKRDLANA